LKYDKSGTVKLMINEYLRIFCLSIIDDLNEKHKDVPSRTDKLKQISKEYSETDFAFRLGYFFRERATFEQKETKKDSESTIHGHNDIYVPSKDFKIEVKFAKSHKSEDGKDNNKLPWNQVIPDFRWLENEIVNGKKYKRAFVIGWFNTAELNKLIQLGEGRGGAPTFPFDKAVLFPFVTYDTVSKRTDTIIINYDLAGKSLPVEIPEFNGVMNCIFLGQREDLFHTVIYY
jgi:hypothetical protein